MDRLIDITLVHCGVTCVAKLLDDDAPVTAQYVWEALPQTGDLWHAKYASNELYCLVPPLGGLAPGIENATITPIPGDVALFDFPSGEIHPSLRRELGLDAYDHFMDLALFYDRNNLLFSPRTGPVPANIFGTVIENLPAMTKAGHDLFRSGFAGEQLRFSCHDS